VAPAIAPNKANLPARAGVERLRRTIVRNKANWPAGAGAELWLGARRNRVKQSQFAGRAGRGGAVAGSIVRHRLDAPLRETKPICAEPPQAASALQEKSYVELATQRASAKQSQFAAVPGGPRYEDRGCAALYKQSQFRRRGCRRCGGSGQSRQTKPILPHAPQPTRGGGGGENI